MKYTVSIPIDIHRAPSFQSEKVGVLYPGFIIDAIEEINGEAKNGVQQWLKDNNGFYYWKGGVINSASDKIADIIVNYNELLGDIPSHIKATKGKGITIAVLDTGCINHPDLRDRISCFYDVKKKRILTEAEYYDDSGHGTFVSGLIASSGKTSGIIGVAGEVQLMIVKISHISPITNKTGFDGFHLSDALSWILMLENKPDVINLSFNIDINTFYKDEISQKLVKLRQYGCYIIGAAGNNENITGDNNILYPASEGSVLSVGAIFQPVRNYRLNPSLDFVIPYSNDYLSIGKEGTIKRDKGSSFACAIVSSVISLIKSEANNQNELSDFLEAYNQLLHSNQFKIYKNENNIS